MADDIETTPTPTPTPPPVWTDRDKGEASKEALVDLVCGHVAGGGTLIDLAELWSVPMGRISSWVRAEPGRSKRYDGALLDQNDWYIQVLRRELQRLALVDIRRLYNDDGTLKPISEWPAEVAAAVVGIETEQVKTQRASKTGDFDVEEDEVTTVKKIKLESKLGTIKALGLEFGMGKKVLEVNGKLTLEDLLDLTTKKAAKDAEAKG